MKNQLFSAVLILLSLPAFATTVLPEGLGTIINDGEGNGDPVQLNAGCIYLEELYVEVTNLDRISNNGPYTDQNNDIYYYLPDDYPTMTFQYTIYTPEGEYFFYKEQQIVGRFYEQGYISGTDIKYYRYSFEVLLELKEECQKEENKNVSLIYDVELVNCPGESECNPYPVCNYTNYYGLFSCWAFNAISCDGLEHIPDCSNKDLTTGSYGKSFICSCTAAPQSNDQISFQSPNTDHSEMASSTLRAQPNPFSGQLNIHWNMDQKIRTLQLIHTTGELMWSAQNLSNNSFQQIDTANLPAGVYLLFITTEQGEKEVLKVIKSVH